MSEQPSPTAEYRYLFKEAGEEEYRELTLEEFLKEEAKCEGTADLDGPLTPAGTKSYCFGSSNGWGGYIEKL